MKDVPRHLLVLGGGAAGVELAQVVRRLGGEAVIIEGADRVLPREPLALGEALGEALSRDGIELILKRRASAARRDGDDYILEFEDGGEVRGDRILVATGRRPRASRVSVWSRSASPSIPRGSRSTTTCVQVSDCGRSETSTGSGRSRTSANTRVTSSRPISPASPDLRITKPCLG